MNPYRTIKTLTSVFNPPLFSITSPTHSFSFMPSVIFSTSNTMRKPNRPSSVLFRNVMSAVLGVGHQLKIAKSVVRTVMVFVMHNLVFSKFSSNMLFHYHSVLHSILVITNLFCKRDQNTNISMVYKRLFLGVRRNPYSMTLSGACLFSLSVTRYISEWLTTNFAFKHRHLLSRHCTITWSLLAI